MYDKEYEDIISSIKLKSSKNSNHKYCITYPKHLEMDQKYHGIVKEVIFPCLKRNLYVYRYICNLSSKTRNKSSPFLLN